MMAKPWKVSFLTALVVLVVFIVLYFPLTQHELTNILSAEEELLPAEAIVVLAGGLKPDGSPKISTLERVDHAISLFSEGFGKYLIMSGGVKRGGSVEADQMHKIALERGVSPEAVLKETRSLDTYENALYTRELLSQYGIKGKVILVTSPYHMRRAISCFKKQGLEVLPAPVQNSEIYTYRFYQNLKNLAVLMREYFILAYYHWTGRI